MTILEYSISDQEVWDAVTEERNAYVFSKLREAGFRFGSDTKIEKHKESEDCFTHFSQEVAP